MNELKKTIAVFAHNEQKNIITCLDSVKAATGSMDECYVLVNGCTDDTESLVRKFSDENDFCKLVTIQKGDKANAWNVFCHELDVDARIFIFLDGDCWVKQDSFAALAVCLSNNPDANAIAGVPSEKVSKAFRENIMQGVGIAGNLYALSEKFMGRIKNNNIRLPVGLIGDDSLVGALAFWDLNPLGEWNEDKVVVCKDAEFLYDRLSLLCFADMRLYYRRKIRYSLRRYQNIMLNDCLKKYGIGALPEKIDDLYIRCPVLPKLKWRGVDTWFDYLALQQIMCSRGGRESI